MAAIIMIVCSLGCALVFLLMGIHMGKMDTPANFWSGTTVSAAAVSDIPAYNKAMKRMWCIYSIPFWLSGILYLISPGISVTILMLSSTVGIGWLLYEDHVIEKKYVDHTVPLAPEDENSRQKNKKITRYTIIFTVIVFILCGVMLFTGDVSISLNEEAIVVDGYGWSELTVPYADILNATYREHDFRTGSRENGYGSFTLQQGHFKNNELGDYTLYSYTRCKCYVILETTDGYIVLNQEEESETKALYEEIRSHL